MNIHGCIHTGLRIAARPAGTAGVVSCIRTSGVNIHKRAVRMWACVHACSCECLDPPTPPAQLMHTKKPSSKDRRMTPRAHPKSAKTLSHRSWGSKQRGSALNKIGLWMGSTAPSCVPATPPQPSKPTEVATVCGKSMLRAAKRPVRRRFAIMPGSSEQSEMPALTQREQGRS